jgi:hypothetical protein
MQNQNRNSFSYTGKSVRPSCPSVRPSIFKELEAVKEQVEFECFTNYLTDKDGKPRLDSEGNQLTSLNPLFEELCLIIAEVNLLNPDGAIRISGSEVAIFIVQEVFTRLSAEHLKSVVYKFQRISAPIYQKKAYLRAALYNAVFESESDVTNQIAHDIPGFFG